jgi:ribonuclease-3
LANLALAGRNAVFAHIRRRQLNQGEHESLPAPNSNNDDLEQRLDYSFSRPELLVEALTHQSVADKSQDGESYERLEFLGDRVLGLVVADLLAHSFPNASVGELARRHVDLVRAEALTRVARETGLDEFIRLTPGEEKSGARSSASIQADVMEAVLAALYIDGGLDAARGVIVSRWRGLLEEQTSAPQDAKTELQEWLQGRGRELPEYVEVGREGPAHAPMFTIEIHVTGESPLKAEGPNKRAAETEAATAMLRKLAGGS